MDVREKLVELLGNLFCGDYGINGCDSCKYNTEVMCSAYACADHLIAHGVMVQEWISVKDERKPKAGEDVLVVVFDGYDTYTGTDCLMRDGKWCYETENHKVTHWQPMPQPPKGE